MPQVLLQNYKFLGEIKCGEGGPPVAIGDSVRLFLNVPANPDFPVSVDAKVISVNSTSQVIGPCRRVVTLYTFEYDSDISGAVLTQADILLAECISCCEVLGERVTRLEEYVSEGPVQSVNGFTGVVEIDEFPEKSTFVVTDYGASGSSVTTLGSIISGSTQLTVVNSASFLVGQGILIKGAGGTIAGHCVAQILSVQGNVIGLDTAATATVSAATVQHDDTVAINEAIALAFNASGKTYIPNGHYRCNGYFDADTDSILTTPFVPGVSPTQKVFSLMGESMGRLDDDSINVIPGGVVIDSTDVVSTLNNFSLFSSAPYVELPSFENIYTQWNNAEVRVDNILFLAPPNPTIHGICLKNTFRCRIGSGVGIIAQSAEPRSALLEPGFAYPDFFDFGTIALLLPAALNAVKLDVGAVSIFGWGCGILAGEHCDFRRPQIGWCRTGMAMATAGHTITGVISVENCVYNLQTIGGEACIDLTMQCETSDTTTGWWSTIYTVEDARNAFRGMLRVQNYDKTDGFSPRIIILGANNLSIFNLRTNEWKLVTSSILQVVRATNTGLSQLIFNTQSTTNNDWEISQRPGSDDLVIMNELDQFGGWRKSDSAFISRSGMYVPLADIPVPPVTNGHTIFSHGGSLKVINSAGTVTVLAP